MALILAQAGGWFAGQQLLRMRLEQIRDLVGGYAPTLAKILGERGHWRLDSPPRADDLRYRELIALLSGWQRDNGSLQTLYSMRRDGAGRWSFVVSPACDLDRNGRIEGDLEEADPPGSPYDEAVPEMDSALAGHVAFQENPTTDAWGTTISVFAPVRDSAGRPEAILGIDFDAKLIQREMAAEVLLFLGMLMLLQLVMGLGTIRLWSLGQAAEQERRKARELAEIASTDVLTGLPNRRALEGRYETERPRSGNETLSLLVFDLDRFKRINDELGHALGDAVLQAVATGLKTRLRSRDLPCRWGGDEFVVLLPGTDIAGATRLAESLRDAFGELAVPGVPRVTGSFGVAQAEEREELFDLMRRADEGLYRAKRSGRDRVGETEEISEFPL